MPINKNERGYLEISGEEYSKLKELQSKIENKESIANLLNSINPAYLDLLINFPSFYITADLSNSDSLNPVHIAAKYGNLGALNELIARGAKLDVYTGNYGEYPLHLAAHYNNVGVIEYLIKDQKVSPNIPTKPTDYFDSKNASPLCKAALHGSFEAAKKLLELGANVNYQDSEGFTPLHDVCAYGFGWNSSDKVFQMIELLLKNGANPLLKGHDYSGDRTPAQLIRDEQNREHMKQLIVQYATNEPIKPCVTPISMFNSDQQESLKQSSNNYQASGPKPW